MPQRDMCQLLWIGCFDRINLDSKIQIRYIDTRHQLADILTKGNFTFDEWNNILHLFNISHFSSTCYAVNVCLISYSKTMTKRMQEQRREERSVAKSKATATNLSSHVPTSCPSAKIPIASKSPGMLMATGKPEKQDKKKFEIRRSVEFSSAAARCIPWRVDGHSNGETCRNKRRIRRCGPFRI